MPNPEYPLIEKNLRQDDLLYLIQSYSEQFLTFIHRNIRDYSSHGPDHTLHIIANLNEFVPNWGITLSQDEALLLYLSAWVHDIGCIKDREHHHEVSAALLLGKKNIVESLGERYTTCMKYVILAHRARYQIESVPEVYEGVRLRLICAIFRLMDACEICYKKCPEDVFNVISRSLRGKSRTIWIGHMNILSLKYRNPNIVILVNEQDKCQFIIDDLKTEIGTIAETFQNNGLPAPIVTHH
jgi:hypothetical protein